MIHPNTALRFVSPRVGFGVFATRRIPRGTIVWVLDGLDQIVSPSTRSRLDPALRAQLDRYSYPDDAGNSVLCWDHARFVNHSCEATCLGPDGSSFEIAVRDIEAGEQLTDDYRSLGLEPHETFECACGAPSCEGVVSARSISAQRPRWEASIERATEAFSSVPQPLAAWLSPRDLVHALHATDAPGRDGRTLLLRRTP